MCSNYQSPSIALLQLAEEAVIQGFSAKIIISPTSEPYLLLSKRPHSPAMARVTVGTRYPDEHPAYSSLGPAFYASRWEFWCEAYFRMGRFRQVYERIKNEGIPDSPPTCAGRDPVTVLSICAELMS
jgi:hypothetical protein